MQHIVNNGDINGIINFTEKLPAENLAKSLNGRNVLLSFIIGGESNSFAIQLTESLYSLMV